MGGYIGRHWRGELGPGITWWVNCAGLSALLWWLVPQIAVAGGFAFVDTLGKFCAASALQFLQIGLVPLWQMVGLWRCGERRALAPDPWWTGRVVQVAAFLFTVLITMRGLVSGAEQVIGARVALALGPYGYAVGLLHGGREISVNGGLGFGVADAVERLLLANPGVRRIRLDSGGGALSEATRLRAVILERGLDTYTTRECSSACVSAYAGGRFRYLQRGARMGVHLPRNWEVLSSNPVDSGYRAELAYLRKRGLPDWFLENWIRTGSKFWYPTEFQLVSSGLVTSLRGRPPPASR
ncbi:MAG: hypothetical protein OEW72_05110 [Gammaproteobacteria bacterium]|nr:hypothetical protein [Gammaproteobacteria bacterium]